MAGHLFSTKPLPESLFTYCWLNPQEQNLVKWESKCKTFIEKKMHLKMLSAAGSHICSDLNVSSSTEASHLWLSFVVYMQGWF